MFFWRAFTAPQPIVDLTCFRDRNFWTGSLFSFVMGIGLYGLTYIYPVYLAAVRGYHAADDRRDDVRHRRLHVRHGADLRPADDQGRSAPDDRDRLRRLRRSAPGSPPTSPPDWDFWELLVPQMFRGFSLMLCMVPINNLALGTMPPQKMKNASGLFNLTRNLGGAVGLALINTVLDKRMDLHLQRLRESVTWGRNIADETLSKMTDGHGRARLRRGAGRDQADGA